MLKPCVLFLSEANLDFASERQREVLREGLGGEFDVQAETLGEDASMLRMPRVVGDLRRRIGRDISLVHAFGNGAMTVAAMAFAGPVLCTPSDWSGASAKWLRAAAGYRDVHLICSSAAEEKFFVCAGVPAERCHVIHPGVDFSRVKKQRDAGLRAQLGFDDADRVLLLAGESGKFSGHSEALWAAAILHVLDPRFKVLAWGRGDQIRRLRHFADSQRHVGFFTAAESRLKRSVEFEELLPASDVILVTPTGPMPALPICIAMASGLPIIGTASEIVGEFLEDRHSALLTRSGSPKLLAQRVLDVEADAGLAWRMGEQARGEAYEYFSVSGQVEKFAELYRRLMRVDQAMVAIQ